jgi:hypothetical protein
VSAEENASKAIALDQLGHIAARMRVSTNRAAAREREPISEGIDGTQPLADVCPSIRRPDCFRKSLSSSLSLSRCRSCARRTWPRFAGSRRCRSTSSPTCGEPPALISSFSFVCQYRFVCRVATRIARVGPTDRPSLLLQSSYEYSACLWGQELSAESLRLPASLGADAGDALTHSSQGDGGIGRGSQLSISSSVRSSLAALWAESDSRDVFLDEYVGWRKRARAAWLC